MDCDADLMGVALRVLVNVVENVAVCLLESLDDSVTLTVNDLVKDCIVLRVLLGVGVYRVPVSLRVRVPLLMLALYVRVSDQVADAVCAADSVREKSLLLLTVMDAAVLLADGVTVAECERSRLWVSVTVGVCVVVSICESVLEMDAERACDHV